MLNKMSMIISFNGSERLILQDLSATEADKTNSQGTHI